MQTRKFHIGTKVKHQKYGVCEVTHILVEDDNYFLLELNNKEIVNTSEVEIIDENLDIPLSVKWQKRHEEYTKNSK